MHFDLEYLSVSQRLITRALVCIMTFKETSGGRSLAIGNRAYLHKRNLSYLTRHRVANHVS